MICLNELNESNESGRDEPMAPAAKRQHLSTSLTTDPPPPSRVRRDAASLLRVVLVACALYGAASVVEDALARAQVAAPPPTEDLGSLSQFLFAQIQGGNWRYAAAALLVLSVYCLKRWLPTIESAAARVALTPGMPAWEVKVLSSVAWFNTDRGGAALSLLLGVAGAVGHSLLAGKFSWNVLVDGVGMGVTAAGGWTVFNRMARPKDGAPTVAAAVAAVPAIVPVTSTGTGS